MGRYTFEELTSKTPAELRKLHSEGTPPSLDKLKGWEFRGMNVLPAYAHFYMWITRNVRFIKCFFESEDAGPDRLRGYNLLVTNGKVTDPWTCRPNEEKPGRMGHYLVSAKRDTGKPKFIAEHPNAVFLDYDIPDNNLFSGRTLDDYVVKPDPDDDDLMVGVAYIELGPIRLPFPFVIERYREHDR